MPRINHVEKCRKSPGTCDKCGKVIQPGEGYKYFALFRSSARIRCTTCPSWKPSQMTGSATLSALLGAQETAEEAINEWDGEDAEGLKSILQDAAEQFREAAQTYEEAGQNIEDGFQHETETSQEFKSKGEEISTFADELEQEDIDDFEPEEFDEDEARSILVGQEPADLDADGKADWIDARVVELRKEHDDAEETRKEEWVDTQRSTAIDKLSECPS